MKVSVLGAGAWGTALARLLSTGGHAVTLWAHDPARLASIRDTGFNTRHLPGVRLPAELTLETDLPAAVGTADCLVLAVPSKAFREISRAVAAFPGLAVSVTKGIEHETGLTMCGLLEEVVSGCVPVALSGPSLAEEVGRDIPTAIVAASADPSAAQRVQDLFHRPTFRVYTSADRLGVELGGALKNVIAIGAGLCDGLGFGDNSKAALITRAIVEIQRLGVACGAQAGTFAGLSGLGDLTVTCFSKLSRNRSLGEQLGRGGKLAEILAGSTSVAEGHPTARSAYQLARRHGVETPIIDEVYALLWQGKNVKQSLRDLTSRTSKAEDTGYRMD